MKRVQNSAVFSRFFKQRFISFACRLVGASFVLALASCQYIDSPSIDNHHRSTPFIASSAEPFNQLMHQAMKAMNEDMAQAKMNGDPNYDFIAMMIPHHQGAVDMARALLVHSSDVALRNLAIQIVTEQQNEINIMKAWLANHR